MHIESVLVLAIVFFAYDFEKRLKKLEKKISDLEEKLHFYDK